MLRSIAVAAFRRAAAVTAPRSAPRSAAPIVARSVTARFMSLEKPFAVDAPDGDHDLQDLEESSDWAKRTIDVASVSEDADAITAMHDAVLGKSVFAVDAPDGEHDLEDVEEHMIGVNKIIDQASVLEDVEEVRRSSTAGEEMRKKSYNPDAEFYNAKY